MEIINSKYLLAGVLFSLCLASGNLHGSPAYYYFIENEETLIVKAKFSENDLSLIQEHTDPASAKEFFDSQIMIKDANDVRIELTKVEKGDSEQYQYILHYTKQEAPIRTIQNICLTEIDPQHINQHVFEGLEGPNEFNTSRHDPIFVLQPFDPESNMVPWVLLMAAAMLLGGWLTYKNLLLSRSY